MEQPPLDLSTGALLRLIKDIDLLEAEGKVVLGLGTKSAQSAIRTMAQALLDARRAMNHMPSGGLDHHSAPLAKAIERTAEGLNVTLEGYEADRKELHSLLAQREAIRTFLGTTTAKSAAPAVPVADPRIEQARQAVEAAVEGRVLDPSVAKAILGTLA